MPDVSSEICPNVARAPGGVIAGYRAVSVLEMASMHVGILQIRSLRQSIELLHPNTSAHWYTASVFLMKASLVLVVISLFFLFQKLSWVKKLHSTGVLKANFPLRGRPVPGGGV